MSGDAPRGSVLRREYAARAADYDRRWAQYVERSLALLRPHLVDVDLGAVLDLCCGTGGLLPRLHAWNARFSLYLGADFSPEMLLAARAKLFSGAALAAADVGALPLRSACFDTVVSASALHYWPDPRLALAEATRILRPGGRLLLLDWSRDPLSMRLLDLWMRIARIHYRRMYSRDEAAALLAGAGFSMARESRGSAGGPWRMMALEALRRG
ncbi:MAG TPA: class I SAM-dependent methyltransferase [Longimicrobiaceae bacterium]|nr:class I SAM-dependent methyltransferase [Longimicrobiaceae bacterium]